MGRRIGEVRERERELEEMGKRQDKLAELAMKREKKTLGKKSELLLCQKLQVVDLHSYCPVSLSCTPKIKIFSE